ncbi:MAG: retroviral-like aspartic protease [Chloroflexi bacterium]|nr:retroviral-like aspartic protease [Chloroflexota bacterium]
MRALPKRTTIGMSVVFGMAVFVLPVLGFPGVTATEMPVVMPEREIEMPLAAGATAATPQVAPAVIGARESIRLLSDRGNREIVARIDTGASGSSIDKDLARSLGLVPQRSETRTVRNAMGVRERQVVKFKYVMGGREISTTATIADRSKLSTPMIIGRADLTGFLIDPSQEFLTTPGTDIHSR